MKILILGNGYIGNRCLDSWSDAEMCGDIINTVDDIKKIIDKYKPDGILNTIGIKGQPNVDWCETHQAETMWGNVVIPIMIAQACKEKDIYLLHIGSGCVFYGESPDPKGWAETDFANPQATYSKSKYAADLALSKYPNIGIARIRMPLDNIPSPGNIINKLVKYEKIIDVENSLTVIEDMMDVFHKLLEMKASGIYHVANPGTIKHKEIMEMYKKIVDSSISKEWIKEEDLVKQKLATKKRSNNFLQTKALNELRIEMRPVKEAVRDSLEKYKKLKDELLSRSV
ncbi:sugar nucleotide-binding protein [Patescibacteria group bacterium]|nr:sugar nucleotide-binding protein [Patescibacteria group bacterium]